MSKEILVTNLKREKGKLYFVKFENNFLIICETELNRGGKKKNGT